MTYWSLVHVPSIQILVFETFLRIHQSSFGIFRIYHVMGASSKRANDNHSRSPSQDIQSGNFKQYNIVRIVHHTDHNYESSAYYSAIRSKKVHNVTDSSCRYRYKCVLMYYTFHRRIHFMKKEKAVGVMSLFQYSFVLLLLLLSLS